MATPRLTHQIDHARVTDPVADPDALELEVGLGSAPEVEQGDAVGLERDPEIDLWLEKYNGNIQDHEVDPVPVINEVRIIKRVEVEVFLGKGIDIRINTAGQEVAAAVVEGVVLEVAVAEEEGVRSDLR